MKKQEGSTVLEILIVFVLIFGVIGTGWVMNINKLTDCDFEAPYKCEMIHGLGVIPFIGMVTGWMDIEDGKKEETDSIQ